MIAMGEGRRIIPRLVPLVLFLSFLQTNAHGDKKSYIVYLGGHQQTRDQAHLIDHEFITDNHHGFLASVVGSKEKAQESMFYSYTRFINGFAANLDDEHVEKLRNNPDVISVFPNRPRKVLTTHSWTFLGLEEDAKDSLWKKADFGKDVIIGVVDTGVWPESKSFDDEGVSPIPSRWRGKCETTGGVTCNRKLIGARAFNEGYQMVVNSAKGWENYTFYMDAFNYSFSSPRDEVGHGTHCLSIAGGQFVPGVSVYGQANGTAKGGAPKAHLASYKVCGSPLDESGGCYASDILKAIAAAIYDGVDVLSLSLGETPSDGQNYNYIEDSIVLGAFHATVHGVVVVAAGGNSGPDIGSAGNVAPWMLSVGATTMNREFPSYAVLGNGVRLRGQSIFPDRLEEGRFYPLIDGADAAAPNRTFVEAHECLKGSLDPEKVLRKIVVCHYTVGSSPASKGKVASQAGAAGMIYVNSDPEERLGWELHYLPATHLSHEDGQTLLSYMNSNQNPTAYITFPETNIDKENAEPVVTAFSSRGPNSINPEILKPDITAPGLNVLAAWSMDGTPTGRVSDIRRFPYVMASGTSMAAPHVAGVAALLKSVHPDWSPSAIKSAIMTTATVMNMSSPVYYGSGPIPKEYVFKATPFDAGSGFINGNRAVDPGLVYDLKPSDYLNFICALGYQATQMANFTDGDATYTCPTKPVSILDFNYPSITIPHLSEPTTVNRKLKNVGPSVTYKVTVEAPRGISVRVKPLTLKFSRYGAEKKFTVTFEAGAGAKAGEYVFGSLAWSDGNHDVRSPLVVRP